MNFLAPRWGALLPLALVAVWLGCGGGGSGTTSTQSVSDPPALQQTPDTQSLTADEVRAAVNLAAAAANDASVIAVTDRSGRPLAVFRKTGAPATAIGNFSVTVDSNELAVNLARTAAFFSNDQAPLSSRTVRYLSGIHFPPGITNTSNAPLYGIENTNRGCKLSDDFAPGQALPQPLSLDGTTGLGMITGKVNVYDSDQTAVNHGGVPLYKNGDVVGAVGAVGSTPEVSEYAAFAAATGASAASPELSFLAVPAPGAVVINGITVPFVVQTTIPAGFTTDPSFTGSYFLGPVASAGPVP